MFGLDVNNFNCTLTILKYKQLQIYEKHYHTFSDKFPE